MSLQKRLRLYGTHATKDQIAAEVAKLFLAGKGATEIRKDLDFNSTKTVYNYRDLAVENNYLQLGIDGKPKLPIHKEDTDFKTFTEKHPFTNEPIITEWIKNLQFRKAGKPLTLWREYVRCVEIVCNTLRINPSALLRDLETSRKYLENFLMIYKEGKAEMKYQSNPAHVDMANVAYKFSKGIRDVMNLHNLRYPKGTQGVMSQKVPNHAKYGDVRFNKDELHETKHYLAEKYGIFSDEYRVIAIAIESCSRIEALLTMNCDYEKHVSMKTGKTTYIMSAIETKTSHIEGGKWTKYITWSDTQKSIDELKKNGGGSKLWGSNLPKHQFSKHIKAVALDLFIHLGKISNLEELQAMRKQKIKNTGNYYFEHLIHAFRHIGAHYWLEKKSYNYGLVAEIGGWHTIDELKKSYGKMPATVVLELLEDES